MPYSRNRRYREPRNYVWDVEHSTKSGLSPTVGTSWLLGIFINNTEQQYTLQKSFVSPYMTGSGSNDQAAGIVYAQVLPHKLMDGKAPLDDVTSQMSDPTDIDDTDDFPIFEFIQIPNFLTHNAAATVVSKAKRIIKSGDCLAIALRILQGAPTSVTLGSVVRCLREVRK